MESYLKMDIRKVVDLDEWQSLRRSFLGTWKKTPEANIRELRAFLGPTEHSGDRRLRIVYNYLTGSGFRMGVIKHSSIDELLKEVRNEVHKRALPKLF